MFVHELTHIILSVIVALIGYRYWRSAWVFVAAFMTGLFLDADHLFDYFVFRGGIYFNLVEFFTGSYFEQTDRIYLPLHSHELALTLVLVATYLFLRFKDKFRHVAVVLTVLGASLAFHLVYDTLYYSPDWQVYLLVSRLLNGFYSSYFNFH